MMSCGSLNDKPFEIMEKLRTAPKQKLMTFNNMESMPNSLMDDDDVDEAVDYNTVGIPNLMVPVLLRISELTRYMTDDFLLS